MSSINSNFGLGGVDPVRIISGPADSTQHTASVIQAMVLGQKADHEAVIAEVGANNGQSAAMSQDYASDVLEQASGIIEQLGALAARASDSTLNASDRLALNEEAQQLNSEFQEMLGNASYNGQAILQGDTHTTHIDGAHTFTDADGSHVTGALAGLDLTTQTGAQTALDQVKDASSQLTIEQVKTANNAASMSRASDLSAAKAANIYGETANSSDEKLMKVVQQLALTRIEQARMAAVHSGMRSMKLSAVDALA